MGTVLSRFHNMPKGTITYPSVCIDHEYPEELPIILDACAPGGLPVLIAAGGKLIRLDKKIEKSIICLEKILRVYPIILMISPERTVPINKVIDLFELEGFDWTV